MRKKAIEELFKNSCEYCKHFYDEYGENCVLCKKNHFFTANKYKILCDFDFTEKSIDFLLGNIKNKCNYCRYKENYNAMCDTCNSVVSCANFEIDEPSLAMIIKRCNELEIGGDVA